MGSFILMGSFLLLCGGYRKLKKAVAVSVLFGSRGKTLARVSGNIWKQLLLTIGSFLLTIELLC